MIRYNYNRQVQPPAPFVYVIVNGLNETATTERVPALLDVGADITAIPQRLVRELSLVKFSEIGVSGFRVEAELIDTFLIGLQLHNWEMEAVNQFVLTLDGPNLTFTIQKPGDDAEQSG